MLFLNDAQNVLVLLRKTGENRHRTALLARESKDEAGARSAGTAGCAKAAFEILAVK